MAFSFSPGFFGVEPREVDPFNPPAPFAGPMPSYDEAPDPGRFGPQPPEQPQGPTDRNGVTTEPLGPPEGFVPGIPI
jgi:hypothetical protein